MTSEMRERVSDAIRGAFLDQRVDPTGLSTLSGIIPPLDWDRIASAVIDAMREPTEAMIDAVIEDRFLSNSQHERDVITLDYQCMIDAALEKEKADG